MIDQKTIENKIQKEISPKVAALKEEEQKLVSLEKAYWNCNNYDPKEIFEVLAYLLSLIENEKYVVEYLPCKITIPRDRQYKTYFMPFVERFDFVHIKTELELREYSYVYITPFEKKEEAKQKIYQDMRNYNLTGRCHQILEDWLPEVKLYQYLRTPQENILFLMFESSLPEEISFDREGDNESCPHRLKIYSESFQYIHDFIDDLSRKKLESSTGELSKGEMMVFAFCWAQNYLNRQQEDPIRRIRK